MKLISSILLVDPEFQVEQGKARVKVEARVEARVKKEKGVGVKARVQKEKGARKEECNTSHIKKS
jgi:hypothetical protein